MHNLCNFFHCFHLFSKNRKPIRVKFYMSFCYDNELLNMQDSASCMSHVWLSIVMDNYAYFMRYWFFCVWKLFFNQCSDMIFVTFFFFWPNIFIYNFLSKIFLLKYFLLPRNFVVLRIAVINLTIRGPLYTCFVLHEVRAL